jgi:hypothetical protein
MQETDSKQPAERRVGPIVFRVLLFAAAASLAAYIPYKYATQLHAIAGMYAFLFPLSGVLAVAGMWLAIRPQSSCSCNVPMRGGVSALTLLWMGTGLLCVPSLTMSVLENPAAGLFASFHMVAQHVFLSLSLLAFMLAPERMIRLLGLTPPETARAQVAAGS